MPDLADSETVGRQAALSAAAASFNGCAALAYRLTGPVPLSQLCVKHLRAALRAVVAFESPQRAAVLADS